MFTLATMMTIAISANAMSYTEAKNEALFLSDKMAYELNLTNAQYNDVYEINLDYLMSVGGRNDLYGKWWDRRNTDLQYVLTVYQYNKYVGVPYFYRPLTWDAGHWTFNVYSHYTDKNRYYKNRPTVFVNYRGGNNKKPANHYADRKPEHHNNGNGSTWRNTGSNDHNSSTWRNTGSNGNGATWRNTGTNGSNGNTQGSGHFGSNRQVAQNTHGSFGGSR